MSRLTYDQFSRVAMQAVQKRQELIMDSIVWPSPDIRSLKLPIKGPDIFKGKFEDHLQTQVKCQDLKRQISIPQGTPVTLIPDITHHPDAAPSPSPIHLPFPGVLNDQRDRDNQLLLHRDRRPTHSSRRARTTRASVLAIVLPSNHNPRDATPLHHSHQ